MSSYFGFIFHVQLKTFFNEISNTKGWARRFPNYVCTVYGWPQVKMTILLSKWIRSMVSDTKYLEQLIFVMSFSLIRASSILIVTRFHF